MPDQTPKTPDLQAVNTAHPRATELPGVSERLLVDKFQETLSKSKLGRSSNLNKVINDLNEKQRLLLGTILKEIKPEKLQMIMSTALGKQSDWMENFNPALQCLLRTSTITRNALRDFSLSLSSEKRRDLWCAISPEGCAKPESKEAKTNSYKIIAGSRFLASLNSDQAVKLDEFITKLEVAGQKDFADLAYKGNPFMHPVLMGKFAKLAFDLSLTSDQVKDLRALK